MELGVRVPIVYVQFCQTIYGRFLGSPWKGISWKDKLLSRFLVTRSHALKFLERVCLYTIGTSRHTT
jgi:hypothetical protein